MATHLVLIPSYDPGRQLRVTLRGALAQWHPVWVVSDGSTDGADACAEPLGARLLRRPLNGGKGAAVLHGLTHATGAGFTHALVMDADGQHPADRIPAFMAASRARPDAMILGHPRFGPDAPAARVAGRRLANLCTRRLTRGAIDADCLFGFRVYPIRPLLEVMRASPGMRGFDFDPEAAIRLAWRGVPAISLPAPVRYPAAADGGVSHFRYGRDNIRLARMFARLLKSRALDS